MNSKSFLKRTVYLVLTFCLASCAGTSSTPAPLPTATVLPTETLTLTPSPTETPTPEPPLLTIAQGINIFDHEPTAAELTAIGEEIQAKHPEMTPETHSFSYSGNPINADYDKYPFYYNEMLPKNAILGAVFDTPTGVYVIMRGYRGYQPEQLQMNFFFSDAFMEEHNLTPEKLTELFSNPRQYGVCLVIPIAPDEYFIPESKLTSEEIAALQEEYKDILTQLEPRMIISSEGNSLDALKMYLKYSPDDAGNPNWTEEKMQEYIEKINGTTAPVVDMTWQE